MKSSAIIIAAIAFASSAAASVPSAFGGVAISPSGLHQKAVPHHRAAFLRHAPSSERQSRGESAYALAPVAPAKAMSPPNAEWDCGGGDAGCSWEPRGWRGSEN